MPPRETLIDHQEAFDSCARMLLEDGPLCVSNLKLKDDVHVHASRQLYRYNDNPESVDMISTTLTISIPHLGSHLISVNVRSPSHLATLEGLENIPAAVTLVVQGAARHTTTLEYTEEGNLCWVSGEVHIPFADQLSDWRMKPTSNVVIGKHILWEVYVPPYNEILASISDGGLGVTIEEIQCLGSDDLVRSILEFAGSPSLRPIEPHSSVIGDA